LGIWERLRQQRRLAELRKQEAELNRLKSERRALRRKRRASIREQLKVEKRMLNESDMTLNNHLNHLKAILQENV